MAKAALKAAKAKKHSKAKVKAKAKPVQVASRAKVARSGLKPVPKPVQLSPATSTDATEFQMPHFIPEWDTLPALAPEFPEALQERQELKDKEKAIQARLGELNDLLETALICADVTVVGWGDKMVQRCNGRGASKLNPHRLVELGVSPEVIGKATEPGKEYSYVTVRARKEKAL